MKFTIALLLCGVVYASALPECSEDAFKECNPSGEEEAKDIENVEQLDDMCRYRNTVVKCQVDFIDSCLDYPPRGRRNYIKELYRMFGGFCDKSNPVRQQFLDNAKCLNRDGKTAAKDCGFYDIAENDVEICRKLRNALNCAEETVADKCGEEARQVYLYALNPKFHLREANCE